MIVRDLNSSFSRQASRKERSGLSRQDSETIGVSQLLSPPYSTGGVGTNTGDLLCCCSSCFVYSSGDTIKLAYNILWLPFRMAIWLYRTVLQRILRTREVLRIAGSRDGKSADVKPAPTKRKTRVVPGALRCIGIESFGGVVIRNGGLTTVKFFRDEMRTRR